MPKMICKFRRNSLIFGNRLYIGGQRSPDQSARMCRLIRASLIAYGIRAPFSRYVFYVSDYRHSSAGSCTVDDIAIRVATTVINHKPESNKLIVDAGYTAMSWDGYAPDPMVPVALGMAPIQDHPELR